MKINKETINEAIKQKYGSLGKISVNESGIYINDKLYGTFSQDEIIEKAERVFSEIIDESIRPVDRISEKENSERKGLFDAVILNSETKTKHITLETEELDQYISFEESKTFPFYKATTKELPSDVVFRLKNSIIKGTSLSMEDFEIQKNWFVSISHYSKDLKDQKRYTIRISMKDVDTKNTFDKFLEASNVRKDSPYKQSFEFTILDEQPKT